MRVHVDEAGCDDAPVGVDRALRRLVDGADLDDASVAHSDVGAPAGCARAVDDVAARDQEIKHAAGDYGSMPARATGA